ncbi:DNA repair exonuclease [Bacillus luteolus]|uniref:DNA repair exonuclease n=1 Tax=Litchfieldia luteola TaxID=682179 RepID=A0ABR9QE31_9BACI|nr:DNA repair exonuclease [Cytobacillus luteolus]MBE4906759.1 DNA repair exonuclease [Cytobacillus luteolus]MBP1940590.1 DNA repair exonuclease SbcCD nuclease subunit [Cytobacillus luteolus]
MSSIKFLHTADLHLDSPFKGLQKFPELLFKRIKESTFTSFSRIVLLAIEEKVDFMIISGDLFDSVDRSLRAQVRFRDEMKRLEKEDITVYIIHGNHDHLGGSWTSIEWPRNVHVFSGNIESKTFEKNGQPLVNLYGFSYPKNLVTENMTSYYLKKMDAPFHIGLLHGSEDTTTQDEHGRYAPFTVKQLLEKDFNYWALGHIHKRQSLYDNPPIIYPGNIQGRHRKESGDKGCYIVTLSESNTTLTFKETADIVWETVQLTISDIDNYNQLVDQCYQILDKLRRIDQGVLVTLELIGSGKLHNSLQDQNLVDELQTILVESEVDKRNFVLVNSIRVETNIVVDREKLRSESHFFADLIACIDEYDDFYEALGPIFNHPQARKYVNQLTADEKQEIIKEAEALLLNGMMKD